MTALLMAREMAGDLATLLVFLSLGAVVLRGLYVMVEMGQEARQRDRTPAINIEAVRPAYSRPMPKRCRMLYHIDATSDAQAADRLIASCRAGAPVNRDKTA